MKTALIVAAHPDDGEIGAGGLILKLKKQGWILHYVVFAATGYQYDYRGEFKKACKLLGVNPILYDNHKHTLPDHAEDIRLALLEIQSKFQPTLVLTPSINDTHQDHSTVALETVRTFRSKETIVSYEIIRHGSYLFKPNVFVDIKDVLDAKIRVLKCHKTEIQRKAYFSEDVFRSVARMRGAQVGIEYAEAFEAVKIFWQLQSSEKLL